MDSHDCLASELISELKAVNKRNAFTIWGLIIALCAVTGMFIWYLQLYDFCGDYDSSTYANGVYSIVGSDGSVMSSDLSGAEIQALLEGNITG